MNENKEFLSPSLPEIVQQAGFMWLSSRAEEHGFVVSKKRCHC